MSTAGILSEIDEVLAVRYRGALLCRPVDALGGYDAGSAARASLIGCWTKSGERGYDASS